MKSWVGAICVALWFATVSISAHAQSPDAAQQADALFRAASAAYARKDYRAAAIGFEAADRVLPHPVTQFNIARAWDRAGDPVRAANAYARALAGTGLGGESRAEAAQRLAELDRGLGRIVVSGPSGGRASVAELSSDRLPWEVRLPPGAHRVTMKTEDGTAERSVEVSVGRVLSIELSPSAPRIERPAAPRPVAGPEPEPEKASAGSSLPRWLGYGSFALAAVGVAGGVGFNLAARSARDDYEASARFDRDARDRAERHQDWSTASFVAAGAFAALGSVLVFVIDDTRSER